MTEDLARVKTGIREFPVLLSIYFERNSANIDTVRCAVELVLIVAVLKSKLGMKVGVWCYTDHLSEDRKNLPLPLRRMEALKRYFVSKGIVAERMKDVSVERKGIYSEKVRKVEVKKMLITRRNRNFSVLYDLLFLSSLKKNVLHIKATICIWWL